MRLVVEGTCGSGKTTLLRALAARHPGARVLWQRATYGPIAPHEDAGTLDDATNLAVLRGIVDSMRGEPAVLVDTLHATHHVRAGALSLASFVEIDRALHALGAVVVVLQISERAIRERTIVGRRGSGFERYAHKFGETEHDRLRYFVDEQARLVALLRAHSVLPVELVDGERDVQELLASVEAWCAERRR